MLRDMIRAHEKHLYQNILWVVVAVLDQYAEQGVKTGEPINIPYRVFTEYCPRFVWEPVGLPLEWAAQVAAHESVEIAVRRGLIMRQRQRGKAYLYWLPPNHPAGFSRNMKRLPAIRWL